MSYPDGEITYSEDEVDDLLQKVDNIGIDDFPAEFTAKLSLRDLKKFATIIQ